MVNFEGSAAEQKILSARAVSRTLFVRLQGTAGFRGEGDKTPDKVSLGG